MKRHAALALAFALVGTASPATAAPALQTELTVRLRGWTEFQAIAAGSPTSAWAVANRRGNDRTALIAYHWNGRSWRSVKLPSARVTGGWAAGSPTPACSARPMRRTPGWSHPAGTPANAPTTIRAARIPSTPDRSG